MYNLDATGGPFEGMLSCEDAAQIWGLDSSTIRKAISTGRLKEGKDCCKYGKQWVITAEAMAREFKEGWAPWTRYKAELRKEQDEEESRYQEKLW